MPFDIDPSDLKILKTGKLKKTGAPFSVVKLEKEDIPQILSLQDDAFASLTEQEKTFLLKKDKTFFENHFDHGHTVLGVVSEGKLVAQSIIVNPTQAHPKSGMTDMTLNAKPEQITVLQGVIVHHEYRGNALMTYMVDEWLKGAKKDNRVHAIAEVATGNFFSWSVFMKEGLNIHSLGHDDSDGTDLYNLHGKVTALLKQRLKPQFNKASKKPAMVEVPVNDLAQQKMLTEAGYLGVSFNAANQNIVFKAPLKTPKKPHKGHKI